MLKTSENQHQNEGHGTGCSHRTPMDCGPLVNIAMSKKGGYPTPCHVNGEWRVEPSEIAPRWGYHGESWVENEAFYLMVNRNPNMCSLCVYQHPLAQEHSPFLVPNVSMGVQKTPTGTILVHHGYTNPNRKTQNMKYQCSPHWRCYNLNRSRY